MHCLLAARRMAYSSELKLKSQFVYMNVIELKLLFCIYCTGINGNVYHYKPCICFHFAGNDDSKACNV